MSGFKNIIEMTTVRKVEWWSWCRASQELSQGRTGLILLRPPRRSLVDGAAGRRSSRTRRKLGSRSYFPFAAQASFGQSTTPELHSNISRKPWMTRRSLPLRNMLILSLVYRFTFMTNFICSYKYELNNFCNNNPSKKLNIIYKKKLWKILSCHL